MGSNFTRWVHFHFWHNLDKVQYNYRAIIVPFLKKLTCFDLYYPLRDVNGLKKKKKKGNPRQDNEIWKLCNPHFSILLFVLTTKIDCWLYYLPIILAFYKSGWQCLLGAGRDLFLTTLAKGSRAVSESECTWLSIIISQMLWLLMHCLVFRYSRKFGLWWLLWIMHPFGSSLHVIQHNSQETGREI